MSYTYTKKILTEHLNREISTWNYWKDILKDGSDELAVKQANGNIPNCEGRIEELKAVIKMLK